MKLLRFVRREMQHQNGSDQEVASSYDYYTLNETHTF